MYGLKAKETRKQYPRRLKVFMDYCGLDGLLKEQARELYRHAKDNNTWIQNMLIRFIEFQKQRVQQGEIKESTIRNYYKAAKLFFESSILVSIKRNVFRFFYCRKESVLMVLRQQHSSRLQLGH
jgi:hypothetical protein